MRGVNALTLEPAGAVPDWRILRQVEWYADAWNASVKNARPYLAVGAI